ncbi:MAG: SDR family NAD(P)-dependent oxidoreductase, partial [Myxococcota bacterium]
MAALGLAIAEFLRFCGVEPHVTLGHSLGEFAALAHAGAFSAESAVRLVAIRGQAMKQLAGEDPGTMAAVMSDRATVQSHIDDIDGVVVANINHPQQVSISGTSAGVATATQRLTAAGLNVRPLQVSHAFHSPLVQGVAPAIADALDGMTLTSPHRTVASGVVSEPYGGDVARMRETLMAHATAPVDFVGALHQAKEAGGEIFLHIGAGGLLTGFARATLGRDITTVNLASLEDDAGHGLVHGLCVLAALGAPVNFEALYDGENRRIVSLPETPLAREAYWPIKDDPQPVAKIDAPFPAPDGAKPTVTVSATTAQPAAAPANDGLTALFQQQAEILRAHAEIIASQNRMLLGEAAPTADLSARLEAVMKEPAAVPVAMPTEPTPARTTEAAPAAPAAPEVQQQSSDDIRDRVFAIVAKVSAFPADHLRPEQRLIDELGFDSLMVADLGGAMEAQFPDLGALPAALFKLETTLGDLTQHVVERLTMDATTAPSAQAAAVLAPAEVFSVDAVEVDVPRLPSVDTSGQTWLITEDGSTFSVQIAERLQQRGATVVRVRFAHNGVAAPARLVADSVNLWPEAFIEGLPQALADAGFVIHGLIHAAALSPNIEASSSSAVAQLHPLVAALRPARLIVVTTMGGRLGLASSEQSVQHAQQAGLAGYVKSLARERSGDAIRVLDVDPRSGTAGAEWIVDESLSADRTVEMGFDGKRRWTSQLSVTQVDSGNAISKDDVVLVSGGAGEIGALVSRRIAARRPKGIIIVGRRQATPDIRKLVSDLAAEGTAAEYLSCDMTNADALGRALEPITGRIGPVTVGIHAAGIINDAPATEKTTEQLQQVMAVKVSAADALTKACPQLRRLVYFSSWSSRFGNSGQTDYAAGNAILDHRAIHGTPGVRILSIAWPPWSSTTMVSKIPATVRSALADSGVTFLEDEEGTDLAMRLIESSAEGLLVVARSLPNRAFRTVVKESFDLERHPYLNDHRLKGRPVVPLASVTDALAWSLDAHQGETVVIDSLELVRGVMGDETADIELNGRVNGGVTTADAEVRVDGRVAYRAQLTATASPPTPPTVELSGQEKKIEIGLADFYQKYTFHGPELQGIVSVERATSDGISGVVKGTDIGKWWVSGQRQEWVADPKVLDASFQLAAYWLVGEHKRTGFPTGFDRFVLLRPLTDDQIKVTVILESVQDDDFKGHIYYFSADGQMCGWLEGIRGRFAEVRTEDVTSSAASVPAEHYDIAKFPEVGELDQRFQMAELIGLENPYFHEHGGTARDTSVVRGIEMINFSSYNYLGYSGHPQVVQASQEATAKYGTSVSASRIASGERPIHRELEKGLAQHVGTEDAIVFVSGHATNVTTVGHMFDRNDLIVHDSLIHDSVLQGIYLSGA